MAARIQGSPAEARDSHGWCMPAQAQPLIAKKTRAGGQASHADLSPAMDSYGFQRTTKVQRFAKTGNSRFYVGFWVAAVAIRRPNCV